MLRIKNPVLHIVKNHLITYTTHFNLNYFWGFGSLAGLCLVIQIVSGLILAMHYTASIDSAFMTVEHIMRDVNYGWFFRYLHANGASMFFIIVYIHIGRGLYFRSYIKPRDHIWYSGLLIFILLMATAFLGYVLPWGQMSYWGATVITNLFSAIPIAGQKIAYLLWGGYSVDNATLTRFFVLHFLLPFAIAAVVILHLMFLHIEGSNNPLGVPLFDNIPFFPYFYVKDLFGFWLFMLLFIYLVCNNPNLLGHPDNYIQANPLVTPAHIVPEWYFLPFYAILRAIPDKLGGVLLMGAAIAVYFLLPTIDSKVLFISPQFRPIFNILYWFFIFSFFLLMWLGAEPVEEPFTFLSSNVATFYFSYFIILPILNYIEFYIFENN